MDVVTLSRLQFAITCMFHFIFVPLTLGLSVLTAWMEWRYVRTGDEVWLRMTKFWGKLFLINFALGVVTGIALEFQFGTNWPSTPSMSGIFSSAPGHRGNSRLLPRIGLYRCVDLRVAQGLQEDARLGDHPCGLCHQSLRPLDPPGQRLDAEPRRRCHYPFHRKSSHNRAGRDGGFYGRAHKPIRMYKFFHTVLSGYVVGAFFVMGIAAWHLLRKTNLIFQALFQNSGHLWFHLVFSGYRQR